MSCRKHENTGKNTRKNKERSDNPKHVMILIWPQELPTLSFRSHKNFNFCAFLCIKTPSRCPVSAARISIALLPQPIIWPVPMYAENIKRHHNSEISMAGMPMVCLLWLI